MFVDTRTTRMRFAFGLYVSTLAFATTLQAATFKTPNFVVHAPSDEIAKKVGEAAEYYRRELSLEWTGRVMPKWTRPCPIQVKVGNIGAGGATTFSFDRGEVFGWRMNVQGTLERVLDSVIPHEVCHTIFACHFRRPLPRWADEGAATLTEHEAEKGRQRRLLDQVIRTSKRIPLRKLLSMTEYPKDMRDVLTLYAEGYALADLLVQQGGKAKYLQFLHDAHDRGWDFALNRHYSYDSIEALEQRWSGWVLAGRPAVERPDTLVASAAGPASARAQSPEREADSFEQQPRQSIAAALPAIPDSAPVEFGVGDTSLESAKLDRSSLTRPVHQIPVTAAANMAYQAFRPIWNWVAEKAVSI